MGSAQHNKIVQLTQCIQWKSMNRETIKSQHCSTHCSTNLRTLTCLHEERKQKTIPLCFPRVNLVLNSILNKSKNNTTSSENQ